MKTHELVSIKSTLLFFTFLLLTVACKKDGNDPGSKYRVTEWTGYYNDVVESHAHFEYNGNKISLMQIEQLGYSDQYSSKIVVSYPDENSALLICLSKEGSAWEQCGKNLLTYDGGNITQFMDYSFNAGSWEPYYKSTYNYENGKLSEEIDYYYGSGNWVANHKTTYHYNGNKLSEEMSYNFQEDWKLDYKEIIYYNGDKFDSIVGYNIFSGSLYQDYKYTFNYEGNLIKTMNSYNYEEGDWIFDVSDSFQYDIHGNLTSMSEQDDSDSYKIEFTYEAGTGNYRDLFYYDDYFWYQMVPGPTKTDPANRDFHRIGIRKNITEH
jgi:hypothetical protein